MLTAAAIGTCFYYANQPELSREPEPEIIIREETPRVQISSPLSNEAFKNTYFPLSTKDMWDDRQRAFAIESQFNKIEQLITDVFYKDHLLWIARQYDICTTQAQKFVRDCYRGLYQRHSQQCDRQFSEAQAACSDAREIGEIFCSQTLQVEELQEIAPQVTDMCKEVGLL